MPTAEELLEWQELLRAEQLVETSGRERTWRRAFMHLIEAQPDNIRNLNRHKSCGIGSSGLAQ